MVLVGTLAVDKRMEDKHIAAVEFVQTVGMDTVVDMHMDIAAGNLANVYIFYHVFATFFVSSPYQYPGYAA